MSNNTISPAAIQQLLDHFSLPETPAWMNAMTYGDFREACKAERRRLNNIAAQAAQEAQETAAAIQMVSDHLMALDLEAGMVPAQAPVFQVQAPARAAPAAPVFQVQAPARAAPAAPVFQVQAPARAAPAAPAWDWSVPVQRAQAPARAAPSVERRAAFMQAARARLAREAREALEAKEAWADEADAQYEAWEAEAQADADHQMALDLNAQFAQAQASEAQDALMAQALARDAG